MLRKAGFIILLIVGCGLVLLSGYGTFQYARLAERRLDEARVLRSQMPDRATAVILARDAERGTALLLQDLQQVDIYSNHLHDRVIRGVDELAGDNEPPLIALRDLKAGDLVLWGDVGKAGEVAMQEVPLPVGTAAALIDLTSGDVKSLEIGARVDVMGVTERNGKSNTTRILAKDLILISAINAGDNAGQQAVLLGAQEQIDNLGRLDTGVTLNLRQAYSTRRARSTSDAASSAQTSERFQSGEETTATGTKASSTDGDGRGPDSVLGSLDRYVSTITVPTEEERTCLLTVVRSAQRTQIEVPCK